LRNFDFGLRLGSFGVGPRLRGSFVMGVLSLTREEISFSFI